MIQVNDPPGPRYAGAVRARAAAAMRIVVVGAGILGASVAYHAARAGARVAVIDHGHAGRATAAGAGIVCPWASGQDDPDFYRILAAGGAYYPELVAGLGGADTGYARVGALCVARDAVELDGIEGRVQGRRDAGAGALARLAPAAARALFPPLHPALGAVHIPGGARVDGRRLTTALLAAAQALGATLHEGLAELDVAGGGVAGARLGGAALPADRVVVAAGAWAPALLAPLGLAFAVWPQRGQISHFGLPGVATADWPVVLPPGSHYLLAFADSRVVAGATRESGAGYDHRVTAAGQAEVLREALAVAPGLADATLIETRIGFRPAGPDARPLLGSVPGVPGLLVGNGLGPSGLAIGPLAGRLLAEAALERDPALDLAPYDPARALG